MNFEKNVFINCPFDEKYINDLLKPILYFLVQNGFIPRLALEISDSGQIRLDKIVDIIKECKYSIHDISKVKSSEANEYARMNMPFELGLDYGIRRTSTGNLSQKKYLILEAVKYDYQKAISDINGLDVKVHKNETECIFECLYAWFSETLKIKGQHPPIKIFDDFMAFNTSLFEENLKKYNSDKIASNYIEKISIPEYIEEINKYMK